MQEFWSVLQDLGLKQQEKPDPPNTGIDEYVMTTVKAEGAEPRLVDVTCTLCSCASHLDWKTA